MLAFNEVNSKRMYLLSNSFIFRYCTVLDPVSVIFTFNMSTSSELISLKQLTTSNPTVL